MPADPEHRVGPDPQSAKDQVVASVSFGVGALVCAVAAVVSGLWWMWLVVAVAVVCCAASAWRASRRSARS